MKLPFSNAFWAIILLLLFYAVFAMGLPSYLEQEYSGDVEVVLRHQLEEFERENAIERDRAIEVGLEREKKQLLLNVSGRYVLGDTSIGRLLPDFTFNDGSLEIHDDGRVTWRLLLGDRFGGEAEIKFHGDLEMGYNGTRRRVFAKVDQSDGGPKVSRPFRDDWDEIVASISGHLALFPFSNKKGVSLGSIPDLRMEWIKTDQEGKEASIEGFSSNDDWWRAGVTSCRHIGHINSPKRHIDKQFAGGCDQEQVTILGQDSLKFQCRHVDRPIYYTKSKLTCLAAAFGEKNVLAVAAGGMNKKVTVDLLKAGVDINTLDENGRTALVGSLSRSDGLGITEMLLDMGANPDIASPISILLVPVLRTQTRYLWHQTKIDKLRKIALLLKYKANPDQAIAFSLNSGNGSYAFSQTPNDKLVRRIAALSKSYTNNFSVTGVTASILLSSPDLAKLFLSSGANVNIGDENTGMTPLMFAVIQADSLPSEMFDLLLDYKADPYKLNSFGDSAVTLLSKAEYIQPYFVKRLLQRGVKFPLASATNSALFAEQAINSGDTELLEMLLDQGMKTDVYFGEERLTPLVFAIQKSNASMVKQLIKHNADIDFPVNGLTPLMYALQGEISTKLILEIASKSRNINALSNNKETIKVTALDIAQEMGKSDVQELLVKLGAKSALHLLLPSKSLAVNPSLAEQTAQDFMQAAAEKSCDAVKYSVSFPIWVSGIYKGENEWENICQSLGGNAGVSVISSYYPKASKKFLKYVLYDSIKGLDMEKTILVDMAYKDNSQTASDGVSAILSCTKFKCKIVGVNSEMMKD